VGLYTLYVSLVFSVFSAVQYTRLFVHATERKATVAAGSAAPGG